MKLNYLYRLILFTITLSGQIFGQTSSPTPAPEESQAKPLELPNYVIEGKGQINVQSGIKQFSDKINKLTQSELDSINSLQKEQTILLPPKVLPLKIMSIFKSDGFIRAGIGTYLTPNAEFGYDFGIDRYNLFANAGIDASQGHIDNSGYFRTFAKINSEYIAPDKFFIFGGSKTTTKFDLGYDKFKLYAISSAPERTSFNFDLNINSTGSYDGFDFSTGGGYRILSLGGNSAKTDNNIKVYLDLKNNWKDFLIGGRLNLDFHSLNGIGMNFMEFLLNGKYFKDNLSFFGEGGFQFASGSANATLANFLFDIRAELKQDNYFSYKASIKNYMSQNNYISAYSANPYLSDSLFFDFGRNLDLKVNAYYRPDEYYNFSAGLLYSFGTRTPYYSNADTSTFVIMYANTNRMALFSEGEIHLSKSDLLIYNFQYSLWSLSGYTLPYDIPLKLNISYNRIWYETLSSSISLTYVSPRYADDKNITELESFVDLSLFIEYKLNSKFDVFIKMNNLLNQNIYIWNNYKERDIFLSAGILLKF